MLCRYREQIPADINIQVGDPQSLNESLKRGDLDLVLNSQYLSEEGFSSELIYQEELALFSKFKSQMNPLVSSPRLIYRPMEDYWNKILKNLSLKDSPIIRVNSFNATIELAAGGLGIALLPEGKYLSKHKFYRFKKLPTMIVDIYLSHSKSKRLKTSVEKFVNLIKKTA